MATHVVLDGPPPGGRFIGIEQDDGAPVTLSKWIQRADGTWAAQTPFADLPARLPLGAPHPNKPYWACEEGRAGEPGRTEEPVGSEKGAFSDALKVLSALSPSRLRA